MIPVMAMPAAGATEVSSPGEGVGEIVESARRGSAAAFDELYRRYAKSVHAILVLRLDREEAQEATQEVFLAAYRKLADLREPSRFGPWIHAVARNAAITRMRQQQSRPRREALTDLPAPAPAAEDDLRERVLRHLRTLPDAYQETLAMRLIDGMGGPEIAAATGLTPASVRVNLHRGMELLKALLKNEDRP